MAEQIWTFSPSQQQAPLKWFNKLPTQEGWYWRKSPSGDLSVIKMELHNGELASVTHTSRGAHAVTARSWYNQGWRLAGPVQPPKE